LRILAIECSAKTCSVAITQDDQLLSEIISDSGLTHSQTLMQMVNDVLRCAKIDLTTIDLFAVSKGPGSFTGIRIGLSALKGLAQPSQINCVGISTLEAMAYNLFGFNCTVCAVMDARCAQVYTALFKCGNNSVLRLTDDSAMSSSDLLSILNNECYDGPIFLVGDGAKYFNDYLDMMPGVFMAPALNSCQRALCVAAAASCKPSADFVNAARLEPVYLRAPQAERELRKGSDKL
jgi:tRNA threonylcarbamoyladenosine biosynthesis protein TsaB